MSVETRRIRKTGGRLAAALSYQADANDHRLWGRIEAQRKILETDTTPMTTHNVSTVGEMAKRASVSPARARMLYGLAKVWNPRRVLEMGTCCGVSTAYIASASNADVLSLELSPVLAAAAQAFWLALGIVASVTVGDFKDTFAQSLTPAPDLVFVDGNHHLEPTIEYWGRLAEACPPGSLLVFDDVDWSDEMRQAWSQIRSEAPNAVKVAGTGLVTL